MIVDVNPTEQYPTLAKVQVIFEPELDVKWLVSYVLFDSEDQQLSSGSLPDLENREYLLHLGYNAQRRYVLQQLNLTEVN